MHLHIDSPMSDGTWAAESVTHTHTYILEVWYAMRINSWLREREKTNQFHACIHCLVWDMSTRLSLGQATHIERAGNGHTIRKGCCGFIDPIETWIKAVSTDGMGSNRTVQGRHTTKLN